MPIRVQNDLPVKEILESENIFVMDEHRATHQDIRPIKIGLLNLMPLKEETELQILRSLSNTPLQVDVTFVAVASHQSKNTSKSHLNMRLHRPLRRRFSIRSPIWPRCKVPISISGIRWLATAMLPASACT